MNKQRGFTVIELVMALFWLGGFVLSLTLVYWVIRALIKYVGV